MWKVKTTINFEFQRLVSKIPEVIRDIVKESSSYAADSTKKNIDRGNFKPLTQSTKNKRRFGVYVDGSSVEANVKDTPLKYTGYLYNNIKGTEKGIEMPKYGWQHHIGESNKMMNITRPKREFITTSVSKENQEKINKQISRMLLEALKLKSK